MAFHCVVDTASDKVPGVFCCIRWLVLIVRMYGESESRGHLRGH